MRLSCYVPYPIIPKSRVVHLADKHILKRHILSYPKITVSKNRRGEGFDTWPIDYSYVDLGHKHDVDGKTGRALNVESRRRIEILPTTLQTTSSAGEVAPVRNSCDEEAVSVGVCFCTARGEAAAVVSGEPPDDVAGGEVRSTGGLNLPQVSERNLLEWLR